MFPRKWHPEKIHAQPHKNGVIMSRFIAVVHNWFVAHESWRVIELQATTEKEAEIEAAVLYQNFDSTFSHAAVKLIKLEGEILARRKLTLWERITGWTKCT